MIDEIEERQGTILTVTFEDRDGVGITPSTAKYAIYDIYSGEIITNVTDITPVSSSYDITITAQENRMINSSRTFEDKSVVVQWTYTPSSYESTRIYKYRVNNYRHVPLALGISVNDSAGLGESLV